MPDSPEQKPTGAPSQLFPLLPFSDFSRLDQKLFSTDKKPGSPTDLKMPPGGIALPEDKIVRVPDLHQSIYPSPFQAPALGDNRPNTVAPPAPLPTPFPLPTIGDNRPKPIISPAPFVPTPFLPTPFPLPTIGDNRPKPVDPPTPIAPIFIPPIGDNRPKPIDRITPLTPGTDGKIEIGEKDFDKIGPQAKQVLIEAGVTKLTITPGQGFDTYEADFKKPLEITQDPGVDGTRKLKLATHFKADVSKGTDGSLTLDNISGLTAESKILFQFRDAQVQKIQLKQTADGKTEVTSTGSWNGMSGTKTRVQPGDAFEKAKTLFNRMQQLKGSRGSLEIPPLPGR